MNARLLGALLALIGSVAPGCHVEPPGELSVVFHWSDEPPADLQGLYAQVRIEARAVPSQAGEVLASSLLVPLEEASRAGFALDVPNGSGRVAVVEVRVGPRTSDPVLYYGRSEPFTLTPGIRHQVGVTVHLTFAPGILLQEDQDLLPIAILTPFGPAAAGYVSSSSVPLRLTTIKGREAVLSNDVTFSPEASRRLVLAQQRTIATNPHTGATTYETVAPWDLDLGVAPCPAARACQRQVLVRFADDEGYESSAFSASAVVESTPPVIAAAELSPAAVTSRGHVVLGGTFDEVLGAPPLLSLLGPDDPATPAGHGFVRVSPADPEGYLGTSWVLETRDASGSPAPCGLAEGRYAVAFQVVDRAGNGATLMPEAQLVVDDRAPVFGSVMIDPGVPPIYGRTELQQAEHPLLGVVFEVHDELAGVAGVQARLGALPFGNGCLEQSPGRWRCVHELEPEQPDGSSPIRIEAWDHAGNTTPLTDVFQIEVDQTSPRLVSAVVSPPVVRPGADVTLTFVFDEELTGDPLGPQKLGARDASSLGHTGNVAWLVYPVDRSLATGSYPIPLFRVAARAGNSVSVQATAELGSTISVDATAPLLSVGAPSLAVAGLADVWTSLTVDVCVDEALLGGAGPTLALGRHQAAEPCRAVRDEQDACPGGELFACSYQLDGQEQQGELPVTVTAIDVAGNVATGESGQRVLVDYTPPGLLTAIVEPALAGAAPDGWITLIFSERLQGHPQLWADGISLERGGFLPQGASADGATLHWRYTTTSGGFNGIRYEVDVTGARDLAGNLAGFEDALAITVDNMAPTLGPVQVEPTLAREAGTVITITIPFLGEVPSPATRTRVAIGPYLVDTCAVGATAVVCTWTVSGDETDGTHPVWIWVEDEAGNEARAVGPAIGVDRG